MKTLQEWWIDKTLSKETTKEEPKEDQPKIEVEVEVAVEKKEDNIFPTLLKLLTINNLISYTLNKAASNTEVNTDEVKKQIVEYTTMFSKMLEEI